MMIRILIMMLVVVTSCTQKKAVEVKTGVVQPEEQTVNVNDSVVINPYRSKVKTAENFIKNYKVDVFEVPVHLTGNFGWSSEQEQRAIYKTGYRPPVFIKEMYPGILYYTKWYRLNDQSDNYSNITDKLEFYDEQGELLRTFEIDGNNPYLQQYPDLVNHFYNSEGSYVGPTGGGGSKTIKFRNSTTTTTVDEQTGFVGVNYTLFESNEDGNVLDFLTTYIVLDNLGQEVNRLTDQRLYIDGSYVTGDGKFLALCTGGMVDINDFGNELGGHAQYEVRIYDLHNNSIIYKNHGSYSDGVHKWNDDGWIYFRMMRKGLDEEKHDGYWFVIDPSNRIEYTRLFSIQEIEEIVILNREEWNYKNFSENVFNKFQFEKKKF